MWARKAPYHYGWDWGPRFVTSGIWRPVALEAWDEARLDDVQVFQNKLDSKAADLGIIARVGISAGQGAVVEYRGPAIRRLSMEGRMTVCNMSIEAGARAGTIAPDGVTFAYVEGRPYAPRGATWERALDDWLKPHL